MTQVIQADNNTIIWKLDEVNQRNQITKYTLGNGIVVNKTFDDYGFPSSITAGNIQYCNYVFNNKTGNLENRKNNISGLNETFSYDNLNRLTNIYYPDNIIPTPSQEEINYTANGNIENKTGIGDYYYTGIQPHAVTQVSNEAQMIPETTQEITYNSFNKVSQITEDFNTLDFIYGIDNERRKTIYKENGTTKQTKYFATNYEKIIDQNNNTRELHYIFAGDGLCAVYEKNSTGTENIYYTHKDYLGSITEISDKDGILLQRITYDAWGKRTLAYNNSVFNSFILDRGFTGHEHLEQFSLINMNGRLYDPMLGRMLSPDNYVQAPDYSQGFNRYSYCLNNPLKFTDPSGEKWWHWVAGGTLLGIIPLGTFETTAASLAPIATNQGYEAQKYISPIAFKLNYGKGSDVHEIGFDFSLGMLKGSHSYRKTFGATYYLNYYDNSYSGWGKRSGSEIEYIPFINMSNTKHISGDITQTTTMLSIGDPFTNIRYENDYFFNAIGSSADNGDRYRTAAALISVGGVDVGVNLFTGDPGLDGDDRIFPEIEGRETYIIGKKGDDPNKYRAGVFYIGYGPIRFGKNSEQNRHLFQNRIAHDIMMGGDSPYFQVDNTRKPKYYWYFGTGTGNTLW